MSHRPTAAEPTTDHLRLIVDTEGEPAPIAGTPAREFDALADLFLDGSDDSGPHHASPQRPILPPAATSAARPPLEVVVAANVPRPAGGWLVAYARSRAETLRAPVWLARADDGLATVQRVDAPGDGNSGNVHASAALHVLVVRDVKEIPSSRRPQRITILAGAGETGAVAAYAAAKGLVNAAQTTSGSRPHIALCVVGASRERSLEAYRALRRAAESFLSLRVEFAGAAPEPDHGPAEILWRSNAGAIDAALNALLDPQPSDSRPVPAPAKATVMPPRIPPADPVAAHDPALPRATSSKAVDLPIRCPEAPGAHFHVDSLGQLHIRADDHDRPTGDAAGALLAAAGWAERNRETLGALVRATGGGALASSPPVCHLITRDARRARPFLDTTIRLHAEAEPGRPGEPVRIPLN